METVEQESVPRPCFPGLRENSPVPWDSGGQTPEHNRGQRKSVALSKESCCLRIPAFVCVLGKSREQTTDVPCSLVGQLSRFSPGISFLPVSPDGVSLGLYVIFH